MNPHGFFRDSTCSSCIMRSGNYRYRLLLVALLLAALIPSCKSPISTTQSSAFTLILPDSAIAWGDSATMSVVSSTPLSSSSIYAWSFGDSSTLLSRNDTIIHYYLNPGDFTVKVDLTDTSNHQSLGTQSGTVHVVARHFDLALLHTMNHLDLTWLTPIRSDTITDGYGYLECEPYVYPVTFGPFAWNGMGFTMHDSSASGSTSGLIYDTSSETTLISANVDPDKTQLAGFAQDINSFASGGGSGPGNTFCTTSIKAP